MEKNDLPLLRNLSDRMSWLNRRQSVLAENVANSDTPKFKPSDLKPFQPSAPAGGASGGRLALAHVDGVSLSPGGAGGGFQAQVDKKSYERAPDGNGVVLEEQLMKVAKTQSDYALTTNLYKKQISLLKMAAGRGGGS